jgi:hypothetical protein
VNWRDPDGGNIVIMLFCIQGVLRHCNHVVGIEDAVGVDMCVL